MNNQKKIVWTILAASVFTVVLAMTVGLLVKVAGLDMLPPKYFGLAIFAVVFLLGLIFVFFFILPFSQNKSVKYVLRGIAMVLSVVMVAVEVAGIQMVNKFEETISNVVIEEQEYEKNEENEVVKIEEHVVGVFVRINDKAENLEDFKRYDLGYSTAYDRTNTQKAINVMENELDRKLNLQEYTDVFEMVDKVLEEELDGFILNTDYLDILADQEGYTDIEDWVKCVHKCTVSTETQVVEKEEAPFDVTKDPFIVYVSGHDTTFAAKRANSDVNILAVVNPTTKQVLLINSPRDSYVEISVSPEGELDKLTHCGIYGVECSMDTLNELYDIDIKYYAQLNFTGFKRLIDAVGGISVYCEKDIDTGDGYTFVKGMNDLNGDEALRFVRERKQFAAGDHVRGKHQMAVIKGLIAKMSSKSMVRNYDDVLDSMGKYFKCNVPQEDISALVKMQLADLAKWNVQMYAITGEGESRTSYSLPNLRTYVMIIDEDTVDHAKTLINMVYEGETIEEEDLELPKEKENN